MLFLFKLQGIYITPNYLLILSPKLLLIANPGAFLLLFHILKGPIEFPLESLYGYIIPLCFIILFYY